MPRNSDLRGPRRAIEVNDIVFMPKAANHFGQVLEVNVGGEGYYKVYIWAGEQSNRMYTKDVCRAILTFAGPVAIPPTFE